MPDCALRLLWWLAFVLACAGLCATVAAVAAEVVRGVRRDTAVQCLATPSYSYDEAVVASTVALVSSVQV